MRWIKSAGGLTPRNDDRRVHRFDGGMDDRIDVVTLAIELPGASAILRAQGINFQAGDRPSLGEAAALEGASRWQYFWRVLFPLLMPTTIFVLVNALINAVRMVDHIIVMTRGGPDNASSLLLYHIYQVGFSFWDGAYAAALTVVVLVILGTIALVKFSYLDKRAHYQ